ncbi:MAG: hypothetical protein JW384_02065 [Nitrosomonadaceae bacterium]|nr:hypothetical protein [Nitrosomonadaceae bacterium]
MRAFLNRGHGRAQLMGDMGEKLPLHIIQFLQLRAHPIDGVDEVSQFAGSLNIQRRAEIPLPNLFDMGLQLAQRAEDRITGKTGERNAEYERQ